MPDLPFNPWAMPALDAYWVMFSRAAAGTREVGAFGEPEQWRFDWQWSYTREDWLDQPPTHGGHTQLPQAQLEEVLTGIGAAIDAVGGNFTMATPRWWSPQRELVPPDPALNEEPTTTRQATFCPAQGSLVV